MTQKELLYMEDAIMHEQNIIKILNTSLESTKGNLKDFFESEIKVHENNLNSLMEALKGACNG